MERVSGTFAGRPLDGEGASFALTTGIEPSRGRAVLAEDAAVASETGDLVLRHGNDSVRLRDLRVESQRVVRAEAGIRLELSLVDRRWKWTFGFITGIYNRQLDNGIRERNLSMRELAQLCLAAMGEQSYDASVLPSGFYPFVSWDFENPAAALEKLLYGRYTVALGVDDKVRIVRYGSGSALPAGEKCRVASGRAATPKPDAYVVRGGRTVREVTASGLVAVGEEADGTLVPIEQLSYAPDLTATDGGWGEEALNGFHNIQNEADRARAEKSVFHWYALPEGTVLPILDARLAVENVPGRLLPRVCGQEDVWDGQVWRRDAENVLKGGYTLDLERGIVKVRADGYPRRRDR